MPKFGSPYGPAHQARREVMLSYQMACSHCGKPGASILDHEPPLSLHRHKEGSGCCVSVPSCKECSQKQAGSLAWAAVRFDTTDVPDPAGFLLDDPVWDVPWLVELRELPEEAHWPRLMSPPHPKAVGSYGALATQWLQEEASIELRWWQELELTRQLEHDEQGRLCWLEVLLSTARQSGKSTLLRAGATWRLHAAELLGEEQTILHTGKDLPVCKEVQRFARVWAKNRGYPVREQNGNEQITEPLSGSRWIIRGKGSVYGYPAGSVLVDEAWGVAAEIVDDGLEPTMVERMNPQMLLASTAHRKATPLFPLRRAAVLADLHNPAETLIVEWSAPRGSSIDDLEAWHSASPHWSQTRERMLTARLGRVRAGESIDADEEDPVESFRAQYLNIWPSQIVPIGAGEPLISEEAWRDLYEPDPGGAGRLWVAVEDNYGHGACIAAVASIDGERYEVDGWLCGSREEAIAEAKRLIRHAGQGSSLTVGASLANELRSVERAGATETRFGLPLFRALVASKRLRHDLTTELDDQIRVCRVREVSGGLALLPGPRSDLVRAAVWALREAVVRRPKPAIWAGRS